MRKPVFLVSLLLACCVPQALATGYIRGSVILYPIEYATFRSVGDATYYNDLNQVESASLSGEHVVTEVYPGSTTFSAAVQGDGSYFYAFEGPTAPGACYSTSLHVIAVPAHPDMFGNDRFEDTWYGYTEQCDPRSAQPVQYYLQIWINIDGNYQPGGGSGYQNEGTTVTVSTSGPDGYQFLGWSGDVSSPNQSIEVYMDRDKTVIANWASPPPPPPPDPQIYCTDPYNVNCNGSPIVMSENGRYELTSLDDGVWFDIDADGMRDRVAWTSGASEVAFLAIDRNSNGIIDDGSELFGNHSPFPNGGMAANGFELLRALDRNGDSRIDATDPVWGALLLWVDRNHDGISQPNEIRPIASTGITALRCDYRWIGRRDGFGNLFRWTSFVVIGRKLVPYYDVYFRRQ